MTVCGSKDAALKITLMLFSRRPVISTGSPVYEPFDAFMENAVPEINVQKLLHSRGIVNRGMHFALNCGTVVTKMYAIITLARCPSSAPSKHG